MMVVALAAAGGAGIEGHGRGRGGKEAAAPGCNQSQLHGVGLAGNNIAVDVCATPSVCGARCCAKQGCSAWTWTTRSAGRSAATCYLKSAAVPEACGPDEVCVSSLPPPAPPPPPLWCRQPCDRGWEKDVDGCCTRLALASGGRSAPGGGILAYPHGANLSATSWEDRSYPWGGDVALNDDGTLLHGCVCAGVDLAQF